MSDLEAAALTAGDRVPLQPSGAIPWPKKLGLQLGSRTSEPARRGDER